MKLNKKGISLIELILSIALIGVVLTFLFQLLTDLRGERENSNYAYDNQLNRIEAIYAVQKDLYSHDLVGVENASVNNNFIIKFHFSNNKTTTLETERFEERGLFSDENHYRYDLKYTNYNGEVSTWNMKGVEIDPCGSFYYYNASTSNYIFFRLNFYVYNYPNNAVDDIEISFAGNKQPVFEENNEHYITNLKNMYESKIGSCSY